MSLRFAIVILVVVVVVVGLGGYVVLQSVQPTTSTQNRCAPLNRCVGPGFPSGLVLFIPYGAGVGEPYPVVAAGTLVPATVSVTGGATIKTYQIAWAPGQSASGSTGSFSYRYTTPGVFTVYANATDADGILHPGYDQLVPLQVHPSAASIGLGYYPGVSLSLVNTSGGPFPWINLGGFVVVNGTYTSPPTDALYTSISPSLTTPPGATRSGLESGPTYASAKYSFASPGYYPITLVVPVSGPSGMVYQNYTWGIYVAADGIALGSACPGCYAHVSSPHPDTLVDYDLAAGGALTLDPAADYYSVGYEVGQSIDESLIYFNGTDSGPTPANFVPGAATCVPGSALCVKLYGQSMLKGNNYTFAIDPAAHFYDPYTGKSRTVYPSDVMFSIIRAIMYTQVETVTGYYAGYDIAGPLVPYAGLSPQDVNANWELGPGGAPLHYPYNNTPYWTLSAFAVNDSAYCPSAAMAQNGCITLHAGADGESWPALLQVLSMISVDGIQEAGWYTSEGADVPGFVCSSVNVDLPCLLPGDATSTNTTAYKNWVAMSLTASSGAASPYGWDPEEAAAATGYPDPVPAVGFNEVGSGPYYLSYANPGVGYVLKTNPAYQPPTGCRGQAGCLPNAGGYVPNVITYWGSSDMNGITEIEEGYADTAAFEASHFPVMLDLIQNGQLGLINFPTLVTDNFGFNLHIDRAQLAMYDSNPINIPADAFSYEGLRATLEYAYPYQTAQAVGNVIDGIDLGNPFGGFLPSSEAAFYDAKVPWPNYNTTTLTFANPSAGPATTPGTAAWYWAQANDCPSGPDCDPELAAFSSSNPLEIPVETFTTSPNIGAMETAWGSSVSNITGGVVKIQVIIVPNLPEEFCGLLCAPSWPVWWFGWFPDYPAPQANWETYTTGIWGGQDGLYQTLSGGLWGGNFNDSSCGHYQDTLADLEYWADEPNQLIPQVCQGTALNVTSYFANQATYTSNVALAAQDWDLVQEVYNNLQLTIGITQANTVFAFAPWIASSTINTNVMIGGGGEWAWYQLGGIGLP